MQHTPVHPTAVPSSTGRQPSPGHQPMSCAAQRINSTQAITACTAAAAASETARALQLASKVCADSICCVLQLQVRYVARDAIKRQPDNDNDVLLSNLRFTAAGRC